MDDVEIILINKDNSIALDYIISRDPAVIQMKHKLKKVKKDQIHRDRLTVKLKNAVMYHVVKLRVQKKVPNFNEILNMAINKKKKEMQAARKEKYTFDIGQLRYQPEDTYLTEEQFAQINQQISKIKLTLDD